MQGKVLLGDMEDCKIPLFNLVLTGCAVPFFHNGSIYYDNDGQSLVRVFLKLIHYLDSVYFLREVIKVNFNFFLDVGIMWRKKQK